MALGSIGDAEDATIIFMITLLAQLMIGYIGNIGDTTTIIKFVL